MTTAALGRALFAGVLTVATITTAIPAAQAPKAARAFVGARIIDGSGGPPIPSGTILVRNGKIEAVGAVKVPADAETIAVNGKTIVPGLVNAHGHVGETRGLRAGPELYSRENVLAQLGLYAQYGVTTVVSLGADQAAGVAIRDEQLRSTGMPIGGARLFVAGPVVVGDTPDEARKMVADVAAMKVDVIKIRVDDNLGTTKKMTPDVYKAVIDEAHKRGLRVATHLYYLDDAKGVLDAGADFIAHSIRDREVDDAVIAQLKKRDVCVCPTLTREVSTYVYEETPAFFSDPFFLKTADSSVLDQLKDPKRQAGVKASKSAQAYKVALDMASRNLKKLQSAGVRIAMGTDTGPPGRFQGYFEHMELQLMVKAGLTPMQALTAATADAARCSKLEGRVGALKPGAAADLIVLGANPLDDIHNTTTVESVWVGGERLSK